jgi:urea transport system ATP-binding protein
MPSEWLLETRDLTVAFEGFRALDSLCFRMRRGEMRVVIGPNGAGKTTLLDVITGKVKPTSGSVHFDGRSIGGLREDRIANLGIGRKFQTPRVFGRLTVRDNIEMFCKNGRSVFASLVGRRSDGKTVEEILEKIGLAQKHDAVAGTLAHGEKQWLEIGMTIAQDPTLLLIDEPVAGMTDEETVQTARLLREINANRAVIVIEHDMEFVRELARTVTVLHEGRILCEGPVRQIQSDARVAEIYLGRHAA